MKKTLFILLLSSAALFGVSSCQEITDDNGQTDWEDFPTEIGVGTESGTCTNTGNHYGGQHGNGNGTETGTCSGTGTGNHHGVGNNGGGHGHHGNNQ